MGYSQKAKTLTALALVLASAAPLAAWSDDSEAQRVARYSTIAPVPREAQVDPLDAVVTIAFPEQLTTVYEALNYALRRSGYRLASAKAADPAASVLANQPLPEVHRRLGPITVAGALSTLAGPAWTMVVDPVHRLVSFELAQEYAAIGSVRDTSAAEQSHDLSLAPESESTDCDPHETWTWC